MPTQITLSVACQSVLLANGRYDISYSIKWNGPTVLSYFGVYWILNTPFDIQDVIQISPPAASGSTGTRVLAGAISNLLGPIHIGSPTLGDLGTAIHSQTGSETFTCPKNMTRFTMVR